jgi:hypothetical protein
MPGYVAKAPARRPAPKAAAAAKPAATPAAATAYDKGILPRVGRVGAVIRTVVAQTETQPGVAQVEKEIMELAADKSKFEALWRQLDFNNNGAVSLAGPLWRGHSVGLRGDMLANRICGDRD